MPSDRRSSARAGPGRPGTRSGGDRVDGPEAVAVAPAIDLDAGVIDVRRSYRLRYGVGTEKDAKTHQMRRITLDTETTVLLTEHKRRCAERLRDLGAEVTEDMYLFSGARKFEPTAPCPPHSVSSRYRNLVQRLGINTHIHALRPTRRRNS